MQQIEETIQVIYHTRIIHVYGDMSSSVECTFLIWWFQILSILFSQSSRDRYHVDAFNHVLILRGLQNQNSPKFAH